MEQVAVLPNGQLILIKEFIWAHSETITGACVGDSIITMGYTSSEGRMYVMWFDKEYPPIAVMDLGWEIIDTEL